MSNKFIVAGKLVLSQEQAMTLPKIATAPGSPVEGDMYFDTTMSAARIYQGGAWKVLTVGGSVGLTGQALDEFNILVGNSSDLSAAIDTSVVGDIKVDSINGAVINTGSIINSKISATANIERSKLATATANRLVYNDASGAMSDLSAIVADRAVMSNASGLPTASTVTATELSYVSGVTSSIQDQIDGGFQFIVSSGTPYVADSTTGKGMFVTGTVAQQINLPPTPADGVIYRIDNTSTQPVSVYAADGVTLVQTIPTMMRGEFIWLGTFWGTDTVMFSNDGAFKAGGNKISNLADAVSAQDAVTLSQTNTALSGKLDLSGGTMSGAIDMGGAKITSLGSPDNITDAATKGYVDSYVGAGIVWIHPVSDPDLQTDVLSAPPVSPTDEAIYLIGASATGAWLGLEGHAVYTLNGGSTWIDLLDRAVVVGDRFGVAIYNGTVGGGLTGKQNQIAQITNATPGSYTYSFLAPTANQAFYVNEQNSPHFGHSYTFDGTDWIEFSGPSTIGDGVGLTWDGNVLNVNLGAGITQLPTDEVGIDCKTDGAIHTVDPTTGLSSTASDAQLSLKIDGSTLSKSTSGVKIATGGIANNEISGSAAIAYSKLALSASIVNADINASAAITYSKLALSNSIVNADVATTAAIAYSKLSLSASIVNADIATSAAIAYSKLALGTSIVNADISGSAAIAYTKLALSSSIINADIATAAAIARSKLASGSANRVVVNDATGVQVDAAAITAARALISDANGIPTHSTVTSTELAQLSGITSGVVSLNGTQLLTNKSLVDTSTAIVDVTDNTKQIKFDAGGTTGTNTTITAAQTANRVLTLPNVTGTLVSTGDTGTVTSTMILDGTILNADINASAAIAYSKLALGTSIVNADIATAAAIARTKIASGTINHVIINDGTGVLSSEAALASSRGGLGTSAAAFTGVLKAASGVFSAATIVNADISASAAIAYSKLALGTSIVNADIATSAAIAYSKLASLSTAAPKALVSNASGFVSESTVTGTELGYVSGVTSAIQTQLNAKIASTEKGTALGVATLDSNGLIPITQLPPSALERLIIVADQTARYALTTATAQNGDTVKQTDTQILYFVKDDANLNNSSGYEVYTAGSASSVPWSGITGTTGAITNNEINASAAIAESKLALSYSTSSLNTAIGNKVSKAGDTMSGAINMGSNLITSLADATSGTDAANLSTVNKMGGITNINNNTAAVVLTSSSAKKIRVSGTSVPSSITLPALSTLPNGLVYAIINDTTSPGYDVTVILDAADGGISHIVKVGYKWEFIAHPGAPNWRIVRLPFLLTSGMHFSSDISVDGNYVQGLNLTPVNDSDATPKKYVDTQLALKANTSLSNLDAITAIPATVTAIESLNTTSTLSTCFKVKTQDQTASVSGAMRVLSGYTQGAFASGIVRLTSGNNSNATMATAATSATGSAGLFSGDITGGTQGSTGSVTVASGVVSVGAGNTGAVTVGSGQHFGTGNTGDVTVASGLLNGSATGTTGAFVAGTGYNAGLGATGYMFMSTGNSYNAAGGDSGFVNLVSGRTLNGVSGTMYIGTAGISSSLRYVGDLNNITSTKATGSVTMASGGIENASSAANTGFTSISSGYNYGSGASGDVSLYSGNNLGTGNSGNVNISAGSVVSGTRGKILLNANYVDVNNTLVSNVLDPVNNQDAATKNYVVNQLSTKANTSLSNLDAITAIPATVTAIESLNTNITQSTEFKIKTKDQTTSRSGNVRFLSGAVTGAFASGATRIRSGVNSNATMASATTLATGLVSILSGDIYGGTLGSTGSISLASGFLTAATGNTGAVDIYSGALDSGATGNSGNVRLQSGALDTGCTGNTGSLTINSGNNIGTGNSGDINVYTGSATTGVKGNIALSANAVTVKADKGLIVSDNSTPTVQVRNIANMATLNASVSVATDISSIYMDLSEVQSMTLEYEVIEAVTGEIRSGTIKVASKSTGVNAHNDTYCETGIIGTGIVFSTRYDSGSNRVYLQYLGTGSNAATMKTFTIQQLKSVIY